MTKEQIMSMPASRVFLTAAAVAATIGTFLACSSAHADVRVNGNQETSTTTVHFADLDVSSHGGAQHLFLRLKNAAVFVCGDANDPVELNQRSDILQCQQKAVEQAVERIDRPLLTAIYDQRFPHEPAMVSASLSQAPRG
jgi:UrcA family protein